jgi:phosphomannomutase
MSDATVLRRAHAFLREDPDADTRAELAAVVARVQAGDAAASADLDERFAGTLAFGTAGLRGRIGGGSARMNRVVVIRAAWGLGRYLLAEGAAAGIDPKRGVVIGFDGRRYSRQFAEDSAAVLAGLGIPVHLFDDVAPTPLTAFAITHLGAAAGVMVTASHNPPQDNGYKVYMDSGAQIIPPWDVGIAAWIERAPALAEIIRPAPFDAAAHGLRSAVDDSVTAAYLAGVEAGCLHPGIGASQPLRIVYTAMHGVGHHLVVRALRGAGFPPVASVASQTEPDGAFPTVAFPNPEEDGAMDRSLALADEVQADLVLANDPDADRLAVALPDGQGGWRMLTGNEVGVLLGADAIVHADTGGRRKLAITSVVSSTMLSRIAADLGASYAEVLTGFKWIATTAMAREQAHDEFFVHGYEEALGYSVGPLVRDKDGISAAVRMAELAAWLGSEGRSIFDELERLTLAHGGSCAAQWSVRLPGQEGLARIAAAMATLRASPLPDLAGTPVVRRMDVRDGSSWARDGEAPVCELPSGNVLIYHDAEGTRLVVRPSGTEPKIKFYLDRVVRPATRDEIDAATAAGDARLQAIRDDLMGRLGLG